MSERAGESKESREEGKGEEDLDLGGTGEGRKLSSSNHNLNSFGYITVCRGRHLY